jgi:hypothetical protein
MKNYTFLLVILLLAASCSSLQVVSDSDPSVDFTQYKTLEFYGWAENSDVILNQFDKSRIEQAFANEFAKRGISVVKEGGDMIVSLYIVSEEKTKNNCAHPSLWWWLGWILRLWPRLWLGNGALNNNLHRHSIYCWYSDYFSV